MSRRLRIARWFMLTALCFTAGCLPAEDTRLSELEPEERERVCKRYNWEEVVCSDGKKQDGLSESECIKFLEDTAGSSCLTTVEDLGDIARDPCSDEAAKARSTFITCIPFFGR